LKRLKEEKNMKKMILVSVLAVFSAQALAAGSISEVKRGSVEKSREERAKEEKRAAAKRSQLTETNESRQAAQGSMDQKALAHDLVAQGKADPNRCDTTCVSTLETVEALVQEPARYENDAASADTVNSLLLKINQEVVSGKNMGTAVAKGAEDLGIDQQGLVEACGK
jgi:hypothetical protein